MGINIRVSKRAMQSNSTYCIWCYRVTDDGPAGNDWYQWSLDFPPGTRILPPREAAKLDEPGVPKYGLDGDTNREDPVLTGGDANFRICFVAPCKEQTENTTVSLERRTYRPTGGMTVEVGPWERVPWEGAPNGVGPMPVGPAIAMAGGGSHEFASVALPPTVKRFGESRVYVFAATGRAAKQEVAKGGKQEKPKRRK